MREVEIECLRAHCTPTIDWTSFAALVGRHNLIPTAYRNLSNHASALVPPTALAALKERTEFNRGRILQFLAELARISRLFAQEEIQLCALKGPLLSQRLFGDASLRTSTDLDILIYPDAVMRAEALLLGNGYQRLYPAVSLTPRQWEIYQQDRRHLSYILPERGILVELHWAIASPNLVAIEEVRNILSRSRPTALAGTTVYTLSEEDLPVYLLIHGSLHSWARLKWLVDFVVWMRDAADPGWENLMTKMEGLGLQRSLAQAMLLAHWLFSMPIPKPLEALLAAEPQAQAMAEHSLETILNVRYTAADKARFERLKTILYRTKLKKDLRYKWNTLTQIWVVPDDWLDLPLPDVLYPLYWLLRPFLWFQRYRLRRRGGRLATLPPES